MPETVAAIVVTYNRKELLKECLEGIFAQTRPVQGIVLIDNASIDGTPEMLKGLGFLEELTTIDAGTEVNRTLCARTRDGNDLKLHYLRMAKNEGSSGGFYEGIKRGYEIGFDRLWIMDDDCMPERECLAILFDELSENECGAPLKVTKDNRPVSTVPVNFQMRGKKIEIYHLPFNGMLVSRKIIQQIGYPRREFFIDRDDTEYNLRIKSNGFKCFWVTNATLQHPDDSLSKISVLGKRLRIANYARGSRIFYRVRNTIFLHRLHPHYYRLRTVIRVLGREFLAIVVAEFSFKRVWAFTKGMVLGWRTRLSAR